MFKIPQTTIQKYLPYILIGVLLITAIIVWQGFFKKEKVFVPPAVFSPQRLEIDFDVLENPFLDELQPFEKIQPLDVSLPGVGRENPFVPY